uniref:HTH psq-type domain-containing protein n=1 Tax=Syphacia muris TaxID=451379 RepID=A0A0N5ATE9_9BILA
MLDPAKLKSRKKKDDENGGLSEVKKRRMPPGHIPFRRIKIPEQWKKEMRVVERCVSNAFTSCTYPSLEKKERLRSAVLDVFTETRTMKESSIFYNVPFTTVQTYFHKSCKLVEEAIPFDDNDLEVDLPSKMRKNRPNCHRIGDVLQRLNGVSCEAASSASPLESIPIGVHLTGASKRKPKVVRRIVDSVEREDEDYKEAELSAFDFDSNNQLLLESLNSQQLLMLAELSFSVNPLLDNTEQDSIEMGADEDVDVSVVPDWSWQELAKYISSVSGVCEDIRNRLKAAICDVYGNKMTLQDACLAHNLGYNYLSNYYEAFQTRLRKQARFIISLVSDTNGESGCGDSNVSTLSELSSDITNSEKPKIADDDVPIDGKLIKTEEEDVFPASSEKCFENGKELVAKKHKEKEKYGPPLDPSDNERLKAIEDGVIEACKSSTYSDSQKKRLHVAVSMVVRGEGPVSVAASRSHLPPSTVQLYAQRTRLALGSLLPPPAASLRRSLASQDVQIRSPTVEKVDATEKDWTSGFNDRDAAEFCESNSPCRKRKNIENSEDGISSLDNSGILQDAETVGASTDHAVQMLAKFDLTSTFSAEVKCSKEDLIPKIDTILRNFHYQNDCDVMRNALLSIFLDGKSVDEVCESSKLTAQEVGAYVALFKVYCESKKQGLQKEVDAYVDKNDKDHETQSDASPEESPRKIVRRGEPSIPFFGASQKHRADSEINTLSSEASFKSQEGSSKSGSPERDECDEGVDGIDVMTLHTESIRTSEELCMKNIILYLVQQQYRRSKDSQDKLRLCLENILLDGLQIRETLTLVKGPSEHVLQAYVARCRDAKNCITTDFSIFMADSSQLIKEMNIENKESSKKYIRIRQISARLYQHREIFRRIRLAQDTLPVATAIKVDSVGRLNMILKDKILRPLIEYLEKLRKINFPLETGLICGLVKVLIQLMSSCYVMEVSDELITKWAVEFRNKHPVFYR